MDSTEVTKRSHDRQFDPEGRRQRRLGSYMTGGAVLSAAGLATGGRGVVRTTRALRGKTRRIAARPRDLAALGVGAASAAGTGGLYNYANDPKRRRYS